MTIEKKFIPSVSVNYARTGSSTNSNALGMRPMQGRAWMFIGAAMGAA